MDEKELSELVARLDERSEAMAQQMKVMAENISKLTTAVDLLSRENQRIGVLESKIDGLLKSNEELWKVVRHNEAKEASAKTAALWDLVKILGACVFGIVGDHFMGGQS